MKKSKKIFILVGEESGDIIASDLIHEIKIQNKDKNILKNKYQPKKSGTKTFKSAL